MAHDPVTMRDALDRYGADLAEWPDPALAGAARRMALSDRSFRAHLDAIAALEKGLAVVCSDLDVEVARTGASQRVAQAVMGAVSPRPSGERAKRGGHDDRRRDHAPATRAGRAGGNRAHHRLRHTLLAPADSPSFEVVVLDPLVFDPTGTWTP